MEITGKSSKVLLRDVQYHPYKPLVLHIDFQRVSAKEKITIKVPLHFTGAELSDAVKLERCLVNHILNEVEVSCLPADLPEFIEVDLSKVVRGQTVHLSHITLPKGVSAVTHGSAEDPVLVTVSAPKGGVDAEETTDDAAAEGAAEEKKAVNITPMSNQTTTHNNSTKIDAAKTAAIIAAVQHHKNLKG